MTAPAVVRNADDRYPDAGQVTPRVDDADRVSRRFDAELGLAILDQARGDLDGAERRLVEALVEARTIAGGNRSVLSLTDALGATYKLAGRLDDAQSCYDEVYDLLQSSATADPAELAGLFRNLAALAYVGGDTADGILWAERGLVIRSRLGDAARLDLARDYGGLGASSTSPAGSSKRARATSAPSKGRSPSSARITPRSVPSWPASPRLRPTSATRQPPSASPAVQSTC